MNGASAKVEQGSTEAQVTAYLISHLKQHCENCNTEETPQWRTGWKSPVSGRAVLLCNACGLKYQKKQYCSYCMYIYGNREHNKFFSSWLTCCKCERMIHMDCEMKNGDYSEEQKRQFNLLQYHCPDCRGGVASMDTSGSSKSHSNSMNSSPTNVGRGSFEFFNQPPGSSPNTPYNSVANTPYNSVANSVANSTANSAANSAANSRVGSRAGSRRGSWHAINEIMTPPPPPVHPIPVVTPTLAMRAFEEKHQMEFQRAQKEMEQFQLQMQAQMQYHAQMQMQLQMQMERQAQIHNQMQAAYYAQQQQLHPNQQPPPFNPSSSSSSSSPIIQQNISNPSNLPQNGLQPPIFNLPPNSPPNNSNFNQFSYNSQPHSAPVSSNHHYPVQRTDSETNRVSVSNLLN